MHPTEEVKPLNREPLLRACEQLQSTLERVEHQFEHLTQLVDLFEKDVQFVSQTINTGSNQTRQVTIELLRGCLQQQKSVLLDHQTRLQLLVSELNIRPNSTLADTLLFSISRLFGAVQDSAWIELQEQPEAFTERLVDGFLPRQTGRFLNGEGQLMMGKFTSDANSWASMKARFEGHQYWLTEVFNSLPSGHSLSHPMLLALQAIELLAPGIDEQLQIQVALNEMKRIGASLYGVPGAERVFPTEYLRLESFVIPFPDIGEEGEE
jgi:hypothetical protein